MAQCCCHGVTRVHVTRSHQCKHGQSVIVLKISFRCILAFRSPSAAHVSDKGQLHYLLHLSNTWEAIKHSVLEYRQWQRRVSEMTILALVLTLFTCREACGSWFSQPHCAELMQQTHNDQNAGISANASYKKAFVHDNTKVTSER